MSSTLHLVCSRKIGLQEPDSILSRRQTNVRFQSIPPNFYKKIKCGHPKSYPQLTLPLTLHYHWPMQYWPVATPVPPLDILSRSMSTLDNPLDSQSRPVTQPQPYPKPTPTLPLTQPQPKPYLTLPCLTLPWPTKVKRKRNKLRKKQTYWINL